MRELKAAAVGTALSVFCTFILLTAAYARADGPAARPFDISPQSLATALREFARQSQQEILFTPDVVAQKLSSGVRGTLQPLAALQMLLKDSGVSFTTTPNGAILVGAPPGSAAAPLSQNDFFQDRLRLARADQGSPRADSAPGAVNEAGTAKQQHVVLEEIVVTATKRSQVLKDVPASVTAMTGDLLEHLQANSLQDYADYVPGLQVQTTSSGVNRLILRGLSSGPNDLTATVGVYVDDVPFGASTGTSLSSLLSPDMDPFDLQRVEVLRGPQGTLYGASTLGGLVKYVHKSPDLHSYGASTRIDGGFVNESGTPYNGGARLAVNVPLIDGKLAVRANGFFSYFGGDVTDIATGRDNVNTTRQKGGRLAALFKPADHWTLSASVDLHRSAQPDIGSVYADPVTLVPIYGSRSTLSHVNQNADLHYTVSQATVDWDGPVRVTSSTGYSDFKWREASDATNTYHTVAAFFRRYPGIDSSLDSSTRKLTEEIRLTSQPGDRLDWLIGGFYDHEDSTYVANIYGLNDRTTLYPGALAAIPLADVYLTTNKTLYREYAAFGDLTYHLTPTVDATAGARYSKNTQTRDASGYGILNLFSAPFTAASLKHGTAGEGVWTYNFDARWKPTDNTTYYLRAARGYRPGGALFPSPLARSSSPTQYKSDTVWNYEVGAKASALDGALQGDIALFYLDWKNIQLNYFGADGRTQIGNGGGATSQGVEFQGTYKPVARLTFAGNATYTKTRLTSIDSVTSAAVGAVVGDELPFNPQWALALRADYTFALWGKDSGNVGAGFRYKGEFNASFTGDTGTRGYRLPTSHIFDLRTGVTHGQFDLLLQVLNVFDEHVLSGASLYGAAVATNPAVIGYTPARTVSVSLQAQF